MLEQAASGAPKTSPSAARREAGLRKTDGGGGLVIPVFHSAAQRPRRPFAHIGRISAYSCPFGHNVGNWLTNRKDFGGSQGKISPGCCAFARLQF